MHTNHSEWSNQPRVKKLVQTWGFSRKQPSASCFVVDDGYFLCISFLNLIKRGRCYRNHGQGSGSLTNRAADLACNTKYKEKYYPILIYIGSMLFIPWQK